MLEIKSTSDIGYQVWVRRQAMKMTQAQTAAYCGVGIRFISDLENGKATMEVGLIMQVLSKLRLVLRVDDAKAE